MDVADAVAVLVGLTATAGVIGAAKLLPAATSVAWKWAKGMIFG